MPLWFTLIAALFLTWGGMYFVRSKKQLRSTGYFLFAAAFCLYIYTGFGFLLQMGIVQ